jgi:glutathione-independent formaldehyde dehydrogenase
MHSQVVECGGQVQLLRPGDWVSVPFNVACGFCMNCKKVP